MDKEEQGVEAAQQQPVEDGDVFTSAMLEARLGAQPEEAEEVQPEEAPEAESQEVVAEDSNESDSLLEKFGLADADDETKRKLAKELGGRLGGDLGKLRGENRQLREMLEAERNKRSPFEKKSTTANNPYKDESDRVKLEEIYQSALDTIQLGETAIEDNEDATSDEVILTVSGKELSKKEVRAMIRNAREAVETHLPDRVRAIQLEEQREKEKEGYDALVLEQHPWLADKENPIAEQFEREVSPILEQIRKGVPELYPQAKFILANHVAWTKREELAPKKAEVPAIKPNNTPPSSPTGAASTGSRPADGRDKQRKAMAEQFIESGKVTERDLAAFLTP